MRKGCREVLKFFLSRRADVGGEPWICSLVALVVAAAFVQAEVAVDSTAHDIRVPVILTVILPPANLA